MKHSVCRLFSLAAVTSVSCVFLSSCATAPLDAGQSRLNRAAALQKSAGSPTKDPQRFVVSNLRAAELASGDSSPRAKAIYEKSTSSLADWVISDCGHRSTATYSFDGMTYQLTIPVAGERGLVSPSAMESVKPASEVPRTLVKIWESRPGAGVPLAARWRPQNGAVARFMSPRGYAAPVTALLAFPDGRKDGAPQAARLEFLDPTVLTSVPGTRKPLAADFSAPLVDRTRDVREFLIALEGLIDPEVRDASLYFLEPYDPHKIPVVLVHGLLSHPRMWRDVINELTADPAVSSRYQFWVFYYPTAWPIAYSAMRLREDLAAADKAVGKQKHIVLIGHSMGGLLARMQAISPGDAIVRSQIPPERRAKFDSLPPEHLAKRTLQFEASPAVQRIIFISTPHRGSKIADWSLTTWFTKFLRLPTKLTTAAVDLIPTLVSSPEQYSSISRLSPSNPLYKVLEGLPIKAPHHSIIGDRGRGDTPNSSDGVVAYWSSHLDSAESEVIVPDDHGAFDDPSAITEIKRILKRN
ncbi:MAG: alpha/beta fold hydrolase [Verrucomicrobiaceae bacterium]|nr:MAG: alpha/beta fold hydrolase [Verrucomicrobiaceae bacterium]